MAETTVENRICQSCGADVRPDTLFCYNCGKSVAPEIVQDLPQRKNITDEPFRENVVEGKENGSGLGRVTVVRGAFDKPIAKPISGEEPKLKSAAAMRRRPKSTQPKQVEVIWEEHENAPNGWFIFAAILLALFAAGILYLATQYK